MWIGRFTLKFALILFCIPILEADDYESKCDMIAKTYLLWSDSMFGHDSTHETSAWIVRNSEGTIVWKRWPASRKWRMETWKGPAPQNLAAQIHTHTVKADPRPSSKDSLLSKKLNVPLYTVSRKGIWKVTPDGQITKIADKNWYTKPCKQKGHIYKVQSCCNSERSGETIAKIESTSFLEQRQR